MKKLVPNSFDVPCYCSRYACRHKPNPLHFSLLHPLLHAATTIATTNSDFFAVAKPGPYFKVGGALFSWEMVESSVIRRHAFLWNTL